MLYFDKTAVMGSRSVPYICQRVTNFIHHVMKNIEYFVANYVDDFMGLDTREKIWASYSTLKKFAQGFGGSRGTAQSNSPDSSGG